MIDAAAMYDSLSEEARDMPRSEFIKRCQRLTDPAEARRDLKKIMTGRRMKMTIDKAIMP